MGKSKKKNFEDQKPYLEHYEEKNDSNDNNLTFESNLEEEKYIYNLDTSILLRKRLIEYSQNAGLTLCEHLDINNVHNFLNWIIKNA